MTVKELSQLYWLNREIGELQRRLMELNSKITAPRTPNMDGMPRASGNGYALENAVAELADIQAIITAKQQEVIHERNRLERYISGIDDSLTREIFALRFINGLTWDQTAASIGGGNTSMSVRQRVYRYLKREKQKLSQTVTPMP